MAKEALCCRRHKFRQRCPLDCECFDGNEWETLPGELSAPRYGSVGVVWNGQFCVAGGSNNAVYSDTVECTSNGLSWEVVATFSRPLTYIGAVVWANNLCVVGGCGGQVMGIVRDVECTDRFQGVWSSLASLNVPRCGHATAVFNNALYAVITHINSARMYTHLLFVHKKTKPHTRDVYMRSWVAIVGMAVGILAPSKDSARSLPQAGTSLRQCRHLGITTALWCGKVGFVLLWASHPLFRTIRTTRYVGMVPTGSLLRL